MQRKGTPVTKRLFILKDIGCDYVVDEWSALFAGSMVVANGSVIGEERVNGRALLATDWKWLRSHEFVDVLCAGAFDKRRSIWVEVGGI